MWNKLFKRKQSNKSPSNGKVTKQSRNSSTTTKCFSFRSGNARKSTIIGDQYMLNGDPFHFLRESEIYRKPDFNNDNEYPRLYQPEQHQNPHHDENQQINEIFIEIPPPNLRLDLCPVCSRRFAPESLLKHVLICERINTKKRKPFDSSRQRLKGTDYIASSAPAETRVSPPKTLSRKASETSLKSQTTPLNEHRNILENMSRKSSTISLTSSTASRSLAKRSVTQQSEKCPHCERVFGYKAFDRHVEWCKEKALIKPNPDCESVSKAKERLKTRIGYRAPNLKTKRGQTRDKYSTSSCNGSTHSLAEFESTLNSMNSSMTSENGNYDPFLSAKKQLEELFTPTSDTPPSTKMINSMMTTPTSSSTAAATAKSIKNGSSSSSNNNKNDLMTRSLTSQSFSPKTPQPIPKMQSNFRRTSSLRISNRKPKPAIYTPPVKSNIHCGITEDGPISPNFVKAIDYDELPIKSPYSAIKEVEKASSPVRASPSPTTLMPSIVNLREGNAMTRKNLKLDLKNPNLPSSSDYPLSKTDSLALFLKYENELSEKLSEKELKDKSNSHIISKRAHALNSFKDQKLPDIHSRPAPFQRNATLDEKLLKMANQKDDNGSGGGTKSHSAPVKIINACDNLPLLSSSSDKSRSPSMDRQRESPEKSSPPTPVVPVISRPTTLRRKMKYNMDNILFDTDPEVKTATPPSSSDNSNNNSFIRSESRASNTESIFEDFDFDQFIASFTDDEKFPIFKDYKMMLNKSNGASDHENNNNITSNGVKDESLKVNSKPIPIQHSPQHQQKNNNDMEIPGLDKLDNLCKILAGNSDSDESNTDPSEAQTIRSKSSADSAYGSLSRQSQSPLDYRRIHNGNFMKPTPPPVPVRQQLELKTTEIILSPVKPPTYQETIMIPRNGNPSLGRSMSHEAESPLSKFCHMCGYKFVVPTAKFCIECGVRRIKV